MSFYKKAPQTEPVGEKSDVRKMMDFIESLDAKQLKQLSTISTTAFANIQVQKFLDTQVAKLPADNRPKTA